MNPGRYFIPNMRFNPFMRMPINPIIQHQLLNTRTPGLLNRIINGLRTYNWKNLLTGANKTLNVVNQTIPLIRQAKPMVNNVKSMIELTKAFGNETSNKKVINRNTNKINNKSKKEIKKSITPNNNYPTFFV